MLIFHVFKLKKWGKQRKVSQPYINLNNLRNLVTSQLHHEYLFIYQSILRFYVSFIHHEYLFIYQSSLSLFGFLSIRNTHLCVRIIILAVLVLLTEYMKNISDIYLIRHQIHNFLSRNYTIDGKIKQFQISEVLLLSFEQEF